MKYIECNHCQKRYPSNRKFEEAALHNKSVRCSNCKNPFQIVIHEVNGEETQPVKKEEPRADERFLSTIIRKARID